MGQAKPADFGVGLGNGLAPVRRSGSPSLNSPFTSLGPQSRFVLLGHPLTRPRQRAELRSADFATKSGSSPRKGSALRAVAPPLRCRSLWGGADVLAAMTTERIGSVPTSTTRRFGASP